MVGVLSLSQRERGKALGDIAVRTGHLSDLLACTASAFRSWSIVHAASFDVRTVVHDLFVREFGPHHMLLAIVALDPVRCFSL